MLKKIFILFILFLIPINSHSEEKIERVIIAADEWCPYNCIPNSKYEGVLVEIARQALKEHNIEVKYITMPWARAVEQARLGKIDAVFGASKPDTPDFIFPKTPQQKMVNAFYVTDKNKDWKYEGIKSLENMSIGVINGYSYGNKELDDYILKNSDYISKVQVANGDEPQFQNLVKLKRSRIDAVIEDENVMKYILKKYKIDGVFKSEKNVKNQKISQDLFVAFSPAKKEQSNKLAKIISDYTDKIIKNGEYKNINKKYGL
ncbi:MAG: transporter substrate-binding domain-containing protein [Rickettsiales bacterium]|nr:transporter substrate-binding domain-containing protein [Rickettsiales bacterium]